MKENASQSPRSSAEVSSTASAKVMALGGALQSPSRFAAALAVQRPTTAATTHLRARACSSVEHRTTSNGLAPRSNNAVLTDTYSSPLRAQHGAANRERWAAAMRLED